jgi:hypothetical protein
MHGVLLTSPPAILVVVADGWHPLAVARAVKHLAMVRLQRHLGSLVIVERKEAQCGHASERGSQRADEGTVHGVIEWWKRDDEGLSPPPGDCLGQ